MTCQNCGKSLEGHNPQQRFCGGRCRAEASRKRRASGQADREARVRLLLAEALRELGKGEV